jgi:hypothetical protein
MTAARRFGSDRMILGCITRPTSGDGGMRFAVWPFTLAQALFDGKAEALTRKYSERAFDNDRVALKNRTNDTEA